MKNGGCTLWTIHELVQQVAGALGGPDYAGVSSGRVRDVPDLRTIRYYTTLGLVDRPIEMQGRKALYGTRHLFQLVAIKQLQAKGMSLSAIQQCLLSLNDSSLRQLVEAQTAAPVRQELHSARATEVESRAETFWRVPVPMAAQSTPFAPSETPKEHPGATVAFHLGSDVVLSLVTARVVNQEDLRLIRSASAPLVEILIIRGLIQVGTAHSAEGDSRFH